MNKMLLGIETEYALVGEPRQVMLRELVRLVRREIPSLRGVNPYDNFLSNGARFYVDCGAHPEWSTPECSSPSEAMRYVLAGERILTGLVRRLPPPGDLMGPGVGLFRCNVDYSGRKTTWGSHESYLHLSNPSVFPDQIVPHLVSRVIFAGAGGFNPLSGGIDFTLSPRAWHLQKVASASSTESRGIFHYKDEPLARNGFHRLHLLCGENLCSHIANWLRIGTTATVVAMIDAGLTPGEGVKPRYPLKALQTFVEDPGCEATVSIIGGGKMRALDIQRHYLQLAEDHLDSAWMPVWAGGVCKEWRAMLDRIEHQPESLSACLDWATKLPIYEDHAERRGIRWKDLDAWNHVVKEIKEALKESSYEGMATVEMVLGQEKEPSPIPDTIEELTPFVERHSLSWDKLRPFVDLRKELFELDFRFGELGERGLFENLDRAGVLDHGAPEVDRVEEAMTHPPEVGRSRVRGRRIKKYAGRKGFRGYWDMICDLEGKRRLNLSDPFGSTTSWRRITHPDSVRRDPLGSLFGPLENDDV